MKETKIICPNCGAEIEIAEREHTVKNATVIGKDSGLGTVALPLAKKGNKAEERLAALKAAGVNTDKLFAIRGASGDEMIVSLEHGTPIVLNDNDPIFDAIREKGTIPERRLFRRWVTSQMFHMLTYRNSYSGGQGFTDALKAKGYEYSWSMAVEEFRVQMRLEAKDRENFEMRNRWFDKDVAHSMAKDYIDNLLVHIESLPVRRCKGIPYKNVAGKNVFVSDIALKVVSPFTRLMSDIKASRDSGELYRSIKAFNDARIKLAWDTPQCREWMDAYKGSGAYFTLRNLILFHGCKFCSYERCSVDRNIRELDIIASTYVGEGWRMLGLLKKFLKDNHVDIEKKIAGWRKK